MREYLQARKLADPWREAGQRAINDLSRLYGKPSSPPVLMHDDLPPKPATKCASCGSHQFVMHANRRICSYCRGEA